MAGATIQSFFHTMTTRLLLLVLLASLLVVGCVASGLGARKLKSVQAIGDLQHKIYKSPFQPLKLAKRRATIVPFFSPDHSIETETNLVQRAKRSIDISIPSVGSWHYCHPRDECGGCPVATIREKEVIFYQQLLIIRLSQSSLLLLTLYTKV